MLRRRSKGVQMVVVTRVPTSRPFLEERVSSRPFLTCLRRVVGSMPVWTREAKADATRFLKELQSLLRIFGRGRLRNQQAG